MGTVENGRPMRSLLDTLHQGGHVLLGYVQELPIQSFKTAVNTNHYQGGHVLLGNVPELPVQVGPT